MRCIWLTLTLTSLSLLSKSLDPGAAEEGLAQPPTPPRANEDQGERSEDDRGQDAAVSAAGAMAARGAAAADARVDERALHAFTMEREHQQNDGAAYAHPMEEEECTGEQEHAHEHEEGGEVQVAYVGGIGEPLEQHKGALQLLARRRPQHRRQPGKTAERAQRAAAYLAAHGPGPAGAAREEGAACSTGVPQEKLRHITSPIFETSLLLSALVKMHVRTLVFAKVRAQCGGLCDELKAGCDFVN